jgi:hypothetical protein
MMKAESKVLLARLIMLAALACGIIGLIAGFAEKSWKLGATGWFTGGTLAAVLAIVVLADHYFETRRQQPQK